MPEDRFKAGLPRSSSASEQPAGFCPQSRGDSVVPAPWLCAIEAQWLAWNWALAGSAGVAAHDWQKPAAGRAKSASSASDATALRNADAQAIDLSLDAGTQQLSPGYSWSPGSGMRSRISGGSFSWTRRAPILAASISMTGTGVVSATITHTRLEKAKPLSATISRITA